MRRFVPAIAVLVFTFNTHANAATISFLTDPFAGSTALTTGGRQVVGGEPSIAFNIATDVFELEKNFFGIDEIDFVNDLASNIPATDVNVVVLQTLDNDANPTTPFGAGNAANLIADQITQTGPGFFIYFNRVESPSTRLFDRTEPTTPPTENTARMTTSGESDDLPLFTKRTLH